MPFAKLPFPSPFPVYLHEALPFCRRQSSSPGSLMPERGNWNGRDECTANATAQETPRPMTGHGSHLRCNRCGNDLAHSSQIISKGFTGRHGRAYLVAPSKSSITPNPLDLPNAKAKNDALPNLPNTYTQKPVPRHLVTGAHTVSDISCEHCDSVLGWKYVTAEEESQRYKVGKFILETRRVCRTSTWEHDCESDDSVCAIARGSSVRPAQKPPSGGDQMEFDSQDEDECEDLFLGVWTPQLAAKRRRNRKMIKSKT